MTRKIRLTERQFLSCHWCLSEDIKVLRGAVVAPWILEDNKKCEDKLAKLRDKEVKTLIFDKYLRETNNAKEGNQSVMNFFGKSKK